MKTVPSDKQTAPARHQNMKRKKKKRSLIPKVKLTNEEMLDLPLADHRWKYTFERTSTSKRIGLDVCVERNAHRPVRYEYETRTFLTNYDKETKTREVIHYKVPKQYLVACGDCHELIQYNVISEVYDRADKDLPTYDQIKHRDQRNFGWVYRPNRSHQIKKDQGS